MKITKSKLKKIIKEEFQRQLAEWDVRAVDLPETENFTFDVWGDGRIDAVMNCDPLDYGGECPRVEVQVDGDTIIVDGSSYPAGSEELDAALTVELEKEPEPKGPPAGSMPFSQSPAYSDKEKERIKRRRIKAGYGHEYK